jgi:16S rRNA (adenine1518-N6/adenine1519-N6)-dimethyltransferase
MNKFDTLNHIKLKNFIPSKKMGQNFLINNSISQNIVDNIDFKNVDCIIEIGPGFGALTKELSNLNINLICVELDKRLAEYIKNNFKNVTVINDDILNLD